MATRKTLIKSRAGVCLQRIEQLARQQVVQSSWRVSTMRQNQRCSFADETEATMVYAHAVEDDVRAALKAM